MWKEEKGKLVKQYEFKNFIEALQFINLLAKICEAENHHPEIYNVYAKVKLSFCTHDAANSITEKDHKLSRLIDGINND
jgi:4a-hydroxytetrahydrobiopterin dehydratase